MPEVKGDTPAMDASKRKPSPAVATPPLDARLTEQRNPRSMRIDQLSSLEIVDLINA